jgi:hypothetical protein
MARVKTLTDRTIAERVAEIKTEEQIWGDISTETKHLAERFIGSALEADLQHRLPGRPQRLVSPERLTSLTGCRDLKTSAARGAFLTNLAPAPAPRPCDERHPD